MIIGSPPEPASPGPRGPGPGTAGPSARAETSRFLAASTSSCRSGAARASASARASMPSRASHSPCGTGPWTRTPACRGRRAERFEVDMGGEVALRPGSIQGSAYSCRRTACSVSPARAAVVAVIDDQRRPALHNHAPGEPRGAWRATPARFRAPCPAARRGVGRDRRVGHRRAGDGHEAVAVDGDEPLAPAALGRDQLADRAGRRKIRWRRRGSGRRSGRVGEIVVPGGVRDALRLGGAQDRAGLDEMDRAARGPAARIARSASAARVPRPGPSST